MTKAAQHFGKSLDDFWRNKEVRDYMDALEALNANPADSREYVEANRGRYGGTWAHPKLAVFFARWLDVRFSVWCDAASGPPVSLGLGPLCPQIRCDPFRSPSRPL